MKFLTYFLLITLHFSCTDPTTNLPMDKSGDLINIPVSDTQSVVKNESNPVPIDTVQKVPNENLTPPNVSRHELVLYAKTLIGIPYLYASTDPPKGFDCSGFITYVFNHFNWEVPRSSVDFTDYGKEVNLKDAREGDLILFTGTNDSIRIVGHMGIITKNKDSLAFIQLS